MRIRFHQTTGAGMLEEQLLMKRIEYIQSRKKIQQFATFLSDELLKLRNSDQNIQEIQSFVGVLLEIEIIGVIQSIEKYYKSGKGETYKMSLNLSTYIGSIIEILRYYGGDILSIISGGFLTLWKVPHEQSMYEMLHTVVVCGTVILNLLGTYVTELNVKLQLKISISCGNISLTVNSDARIKQLVIYGDAINSLRECMAAASAGDLLVTDNTWPHMQHGRYAIKLIQEKYVKILKLIYRSTEEHTKELFNERFNFIANMINKHEAHYKLLYTKILSTRLMTNSKLTEKFIKQLPRREEIKFAVRNWTIHTIKPLINEVVYLHITENQPPEYLTEIREVTTLNLMIFLSTSTIPEQFETLNNIMDVIIQNNQRLSTVINTISVKNECIAITIVFGLILVNHTNESMDALLYAYKAKCEFESFKNVAVVSVGISSGIVLCSVIGHPLRREYAIIGWPVQKANCLSTSYPNKVTCDYNIFDTSKLSSLYFLLLNNSPENTASDYIFEYNEKFDTTEAWPILKPLVDREQEYNLLTAMMQDPSQVGFSCSLIGGPEMIGKSMLLKHLRESAIKSNYCTIYLELQDFLTYPFYCVSELYAKIFDNTFLAHENISYLENIPRRICIANDDPDINEDIAFEKYYILNQFRDILRLSLRPMIIIIDNVEWMDFHSWEILEITFPFLNARLILGGKPELSSFNLQQKIEFNNAIRRIQLQPLKMKYIGQIVCTMLEVLAASTRLVQMMEESSKGVPGMVTCALLRLINKNQIHLKLEKLKTIDVKAYVINENKSLPHSDATVSIIDFSDARTLNVNKFTIDHVQMDLFDSLTTFQQFVVKSASVIGNTVPRTFLIATLNYPSEKSFSECIQILFNERIFECGSRYITIHGDKSKRCCCYFDTEYFAEKSDKKTRVLPKYAYCKLLHFQNSAFRQIAYKRISDNERNELHVLCSELHEKMDHICPNCVRHPANYYITFGKYKDFIDFCSDPTNQRYDGYEYIPDSGNEIKETLISFKQERLLHAESYTQLYKFVHAGRSIHQKACRCIQMMHTVFQDIIYHATASNEFGKIVFYKVKLGLVKLCLRDIPGAIKELSEARDLSLTQKGTRESKVIVFFRQYHVSVSSIALAMCHIKLKNFKAARRNIFLALRQHHMPTLMFSFKHLTFLFRRPHMRLRTIRKFQNTETLFAWELGVALFICAKLFAIDKNWNFARDCCEYGIAIMTSVNRNIPMLLDVYCEAVEIYKNSEDDANWQRLQKYILAEYQANFTNNTFYYHTFYNLLDVLIDVHIVRGALKEAVLLGYRFMHIASRSSANVEPKLLLLLCEMTIYTLRFSDFRNMFKSLTRNLQPSHRNGFLYYYFIALYCYVLTGFTVVPFYDIQSYAKTHIANSLIDTYTVISFKILMQIEMTRMGHPDIPEMWQVKTDYSQSHLSDYRIVRVMIIQMECYLLQQRDRNYRLDVQDNQHKIEGLFELIHKAITYTKIYKPAYLLLLAWYRRQCSRRLDAKKLLKKAKRLAKNHNNWFCVALAMRLKRYWAGGYALEYINRPVVTIHEATSYTFEQFSQFMHPYVLR